MHQLSTSSARSMRPVDYRSMLSALATTPRAWHSCQGSPAQQADKGVWCSRAVGWRFGKHLGAAIPLVIQFLTNAEEGCDELQVLLLAPVPAGLPAGQILVWCVLCSFTESSMPESCTCAEAYGDLACLSHRHLQDLESLMQRHQMGIRLFRACVQPPHIRVTAQPHARRCAQSQAPALASRAHNTQIFFLARIFLVLDLGYKANLASDIGVLIEPSAEVIAAGRSTACSRWSSWCWRLLTMPGAFTTSWSLWC